jgi:hypothetical protein
MYTELYWRASNYYPDGEALLRQKNSFRKKKE